MWIDASDGLNVFAEKEAEAVKEFTGKIIAIVHRLDDVEEKWVVAPENLSFSEKEIMEQIKFQEQYFKSEIRM